MVGLYIEHQVTYVKHPKSNGQVEATNKVILPELKIKRLGQAKQLLKVL